MEQKLLEVLGAITFMVLGVVIVVGALFFLAGLSFLAFPLMLLVLILGVLALVTGATMFMDSRSD